MRKRFMAAMIAVAIVTVAVPLVLAQRGGGPRRVQGIPCINDWQLPDGCEERTGTHDPRDLSGVWTRYQGAGNMGNDVKLTPLGQKLWEANLPSFGPRAVVPAKGNDPMGLCVPLPPYLLWGGSRNTPPCLSAPSWPCCPRPRGAAPLDPLIPFSKIPPERGTLCDSPRILGES